jgi:hypothetical protein
VFTAVFTKEAHTYCQFKDLFHHLEFIVTQAHQTVTFQAHFCCKSICVHIGKAVTAFVGIVAVIAAALLNVTSCVEFISSVKTKV